MISGREGDEWRVVESILMRYEIGEHTYTTSAGWSIVG